MIRPATVDDIDELLRLTEEMDRFHGVTDFDEPGLRRRQLRDAMFGDLPAANVLLALEEDAAVGFATYSFLWPAVGLTRSLYLKELYVHGGRQRRGIGRSLMEALFEVAREHGCSRMEWTTDRDNPAAQAFYRSLGVEPNDGKIFYRLER